VKASNWDARNRLTAIAGATTNYLYDGADVVQELSGTTPTANLLTGLGIDERFSRTTGGAASRSNRAFLFRPS
jgi:uncharacterized protein RhaS with RHS repeats